MYNQDKALVALDFIMRSIKRVNTHFKCAKVEFGDLIEKLNNADAPNTQNKES